jgi:hypothetical protein
MATRIRLSIHNRCAHTQYTAGCEDCERIVRVIRRAADKIATLQRQTPLTALTLIVDFSTQSYSIPKEVLQDEHFQ